MTIKDDIQDIIDSNNLGDKNDNATLLMELSTYMYDTTLDEIINNPEYSKDIYNLQFNYNKIHVMLTQLSQLNLKYYKKCILLSYIFLKIRGIDTEIANPPTLSLEPIVSPSSSFDWPNITRPRLPAFSLPTISLPTFGNPFARSKTPEIDTSEIDTSDMSELLIISGLLLLLDEDDFKPS